MRSDFAEYQQDEESSREGGIVHKRMRSDNQGMKKRNNRSSSMSLMGQLQPLGVGKKGSDSEEEKQ